MKSKTILLALVTIIVLSTLAFLLSQNDVPTSDQESVVAQEAPQPKKEQSSDRCFEEYQFDLALSHISRTSEITKSCALAVLENTKPESFTDLPISLMQTIGSADINAGWEDFPGLDKECLSAKKHISNAEFYGCVEDLERSLQKILRGLIVHNLEKQIFVDVKEFPLSPEIYIENMQQYWRDWYVSTLLDGGERDVQCSIEAEITFSGSVQATKKSLCRSKETAKDILWLLSLIKT